MMKSQNKKIEYNRFQYFQISEFMMIFPGMSCHTFQITVTSQARAEATSGFPVLIIASNRKGLSANVGS